MFKKLYVGGLSYNTTESLLQDLFAASGHVQSVKVITDRDTGRSKGFGFVEMATNEEAQDAINKLDGKDFDGRRIAVTEARPQSTSRNTIRSW